MRSSVVVVAQFSESFSDLWEQLAVDLSADLKCLPANDLWSVPPDADVLVVSASGRESQARDWMERRSVPTGVTVLAVGSDTDRRTAAQLVGCGAADYFALPYDIEILRNAMAAALSRRRGLATSQADDESYELGAFRAILGESPTLQATLQRAARVAQHDSATALIVGETGTGKELLARAIHEGGPRHGAPFVPVNCSVLPGHLIESELFGHERGAFSDAHAAKPGLFEVAEGGTVFLDQIGSLPIELQAKLLRVLEDREVRRVGGTKSRLVNVRILAATNVDLGEAVRMGLFRENLYHRIGVVTLTLPPLRDRGEDSALIAAELLRTLATQHGLQVPPLGPEVRRALLRYTWPGNVRELKNALERALLLSPPGELRVAELLPARRHNASNGGPLPFPATLDSITSAAARAMLAVARGNVSEAARRLQVSRRRLRRLLHLQSDAKN